jgi:hypothetical protein
MTAGYLCMKGKENTQYINLFLPFELRISKIFNLFNEAIHWIMNFKGWDLCHYIDDFLMILLPDKSPDDVVKASSDFSNTREAMGFHNRDQEKQRRYNDGFPGSGNGHYDLIQCI